MTQVPYALYRAEQVRELDRIVIEDFKIPGATLMGRAGAAAYGLLREGWPQADRIAVLCGVGNNGGDGFVVACLAHEAGLKVSVFQVGDHGDSIKSSRLTDDALAAFKTMLDTGLQPEPFTNQSLTDYDVIVDALFGTGLDRNVEGVWQQAIQATNNSTSAVLAIDMPSGLHADTGRILGVAVKAHKTISFIGLKQGMYTAMGPDCCGETYFNDLQVPEKIYDRVTANTSRISYNLYKDYLPARPRHVHKGHHGHVLVVGGDHGMSGAVRLAGESVARIGAGLVSIATRDSHAAMLSIGRPELMCHGVESPAELRLLLEKATVVAIGPGIGQSSWAQQLFATALEAKKPMVVDADALHLLAADPIRRDHWVLTPHPGEAAHLLGATTQAIQDDRFAAVKALQNQYGGVCVLKGTGTLVYDGQDAISLCDGGNPGMASGGMGDVLTGVIAGLIAQGLALPIAAKLGVCMHAFAGDRASIAGERGMLASDVIAQLRRLSNP